MHLHSPPHFIGFINHIKSSNKMQTRKFFISKASATEYVHRLFLFLSLRGSALLAFIGASIIEFSNTQPDFHTLLIRVIVLSILFTHVLQGNGKLNLALSIFFIGHFLVLLLNHFQVALHLVDLIHNTMRLTIIASGFITISQSR